MAFDPISAALDIGGKIIDRVWPNPEEKAKAQLALLELQQKGELTQIVGQLEVNKVEAGSQSMFVAGWRPFIGWVCGSGLVVEFIVGPLLTWICLLFGKVIEFPKLDMGTLLTLLIGMLGLGGMRSFEKYHEVATVGHGSKK
jgi:hypothetical protein